MVTSMNGSVTWSWSPSAGSEAVCIAACRTEGDCQPNFRRDVLPDPSKSCGPYHRAGTEQATSPCTTAQTKPTWTSQRNHDTIAMVAIDAHGNIAAGASSNGAAHKARLPWDVLLALGTVRVNLHQVVCVRSGAWQNRRCLCGWRCIVC